MAFSKRKLLNQPAKAFPSLREGKGNADITSDTYQILPPFSNHIHRLQSEAFDHLLVGLIPDRRGQVQRGDAGKLVLADGVEGYLDDLRRHLGQGRRFIDDHRVRSGVKLLQLLDQDLEVVPLVAREIKPLISGAFGLP